MMRFTALCAVLLMASVGQAALGKMDSCFVSYTSGLGVPVCLEERSTPTGLRFFVGMPTNFDSIDDYYLPVGQCYQFKKTQEVVRGGKDVLELTMDNATWEFIIDKVLPSGQRNGQLVLKRSGGKTDTLRLEEASAADVQKFKNVFVPYQTSDLETVCQSEMR